MYKQRQRIAQNHYEIKDLPYFKIDSFNLNQTITYSKMMHIRNITHKYNQLISKIFAFWLYLPTLHKQSESMQQELHPQVVVVTEIPIMTLDTLTYLYHQLLNSNKISKEEWNFVGKIEEFKSFGGQAIQQVLMSEYQIKLKPKTENITFGVFYHPQQNVFRLKGIIRITEFQVSPSFFKSKQNARFHQGIKIENKTVIDAIYHKHFIERIKFCNQTNFSRKQSASFNEKYQLFYSRQTKHMDQQLLQLQVYHNFPSLRLKSFMPISFVDRFDGSSLLGPIFSNSNPNCMFGHFIGYNWNSGLEVQNMGTCSLCYIQMKELKRNFLLEYLRDNVYNPYKESIQYIPQYNRFRIMRKKQEYEYEEQMRKNIQKLSISQNPDDQMQEETTNTPALEIRYTNYMHFLSFTKKTYTKSRIKIIPTRQLEKVSFLFSLNSNHCFRYELTEPARGKTCQHLQFADLRLYYANIYYKSNGFISQPYFLCPICNNQLKDTEIVYLKEVMPALKYLKKEMFDSEEQQFFFGQSENSDRQPEMESAQIIINNVMQKVFVEFSYLKNHQRHNFYEQIENLYPSFIDPYIHFSQYDLGIRNHNRNLFSAMEERNYEEQEVYKQFEKKWYSFDTEKLAI